MKKYTYTTKTLLHSVFLPPIINHYFSKNDSIIWTMLHCRFDHIHEGNPLEMCKMKWMDGLHIKFPTKDRIHKRDWWICSRGNLDHPPHGIELNTDHIYLYQLYNTHRVLFCKHNINSCIYSSFDDIGCTDTENVVVSNPTKTSIVRYQYSSEPKWKEYEDQIKTYV